MLKDIHTLNLLIFILLVAFGHKANANQEPSLSLTDSTVIIILPTKDSIEAKILHRTKNRIMVQHPYLGRLRLRKEIFENSNDIFKEVRKWYKEDPSVNYTFLRNHTAFVKCKYPTNIDYTFFSIYSFDALAFNKTLISSSFKFYNFFYDNRWAYNIGIKQQLYLSKNNSFAIAVTGKFEIGNQYEHRYGDLYDRRGNWGVVSSIKIKRRIKIHSKIHYTLLNDVKYNNYGYGYYVYPSLFQYDHNVGLSICFDLQLTCASKLFIEEAMNFEFANKDARSNPYVSDYYGINYRRKYNMLHGVLGIGFRFIMRRCTFDVGMINYHYFIEENRKYGSSIISLPFPWFNARFAIGKKN